MTKYTNYTTLLLCLLLPISAYSMDSLTVDAMGKVGIGTATPTGNLHMFGAENEDVFAGMGVDLDTGPAFNYGYAGSSFGVGAGFFNVRPHASAVSPNPSLRFATANVTKMIVTDTGNVGIGDNFINPTSKLHVQGGDIRVEGGSFIDNGTTLDVPDYVFEKDYKLMPLTKLQDYIRIEKHLPGVKSAKEVKKEGLNISLTQMVLLKKIEELTLYTLEQNRRISNLESMVVKFDKENN